MIIKTERLWVPCGKCNFCLQNKRNEWAFRMAYELKRSRTAVFITLTYDQESLPLEQIGKFGYMVLVKKDLQVFLKSLKQYQSRYIKRQPKEARLKLSAWKIRYYAVGEYGTRLQRPHYHAIIYNLLNEVTEKLELGMIWDKGRIHFGSVTDASIQYTAKYQIDKTNNDNFLDVRPKPFALISKGIGGDYVAKRGQWHREGERLYCSTNGVKVRMPRYFKDKIFTQEERNKLGKKAAEEQEIREEKIMVDMGLDRYNEMLVEKHNMVRVKSKNLNKF